MLPIKNLFIVAVSAMTFASCGKDNQGNFDTEGTFTQRDQNGRPAVNTVFITRKDEFNVTPPSMMSAGFKTEITNKLTAFGYTSNALGQNKDAFASLLATDVLNAKTSGTTTFFDGSNVLTGRKLEDDVIDVELLLIFGGPTGISNPGLTIDNVNANDKPFLTSFPFLAAPH